jgi:hypothetical protein
MGYYDSPSLIGTLFCRPSLIFDVTAISAGVNEVTFGAGEDIKGFVFGGVFGEFTKYFIKNERRKYYSNGQRVELINVSWLIFFPPSSMMNFL